MDKGHNIPPVMITVANRTETSSRIRYAFEHNQILIKELCDSERTLQIDSNVLDQAEAAENSVVIDEDGNKLTKKQQAELLRLQVDTVGKAGKAGEQIQNVISVGMLSEGWDASTVTHIMGLRAFSSQLLCEQVVGRGLRRTSYDVGEDGLFAPEYVNIFGVPFTFLPHEGGEGPPPPPPPPKTIIEPVQEKEEHGITWPNILRVDHIYRSQLSIDLDKVAVIELDPYESITEAGLAAIIAGKPNPAALSEIDLKEIGEKFRLQTIIFETAKRIFNYEKPNWKGRQEIFLVQLIRIVERFIASGKVSIKNDLFRQGELHRRILIMLNLNKIIQHIWEAIRTENTVKVLPVFDNENPIRSTANMRTWHTSKPCEWTLKSHINFCVFDSTWEASEAYVLDRNRNVKSWVKNDHIGFMVLYNYQGVVRKYYPDFIIRLTNGEHLILETKGKDTQQNKTKRAFLDEWVKAANNHGGFGRWKWAVSFHPSDLEGILDTAGIRQDDPIASQSARGVQPHYIDDQEIYFYDEIAEDANVLSLATFKIHTNVPYAPDKSGIMDLPPYQELLARGIVSKEILSNYLMIIGEFQNRLNKYGLQKYNFKTNNQGGLIWALRNAKKGTTLYEIVVSAYGYSVAVGGPLMAFLMMYPKAADGFERLKKDIHDRFRLNDAEESKSEIILNANFEEEVKRWREKNKEH